jgi:Tfp pilus assembly protein PilV
MRSFRPLQRGISLVEALVAMLVMSFGMLAIVGLQATLRLNADVAKQRAEAVRIAQAEVERWRGFGSLAGGVDEESWANLASSAAVAIAGQNATYTMTRTVTDAPDGNLKTLVVDVTWRDRLDAPQGVRLSTNVAGIAPELGGAAGVASPGVPSRSLGARRAEIPMQARDLGDGSSGWMPPGGGAGVAWVFGNVSGLVRICDTTAADTEGLSLANIDNCANTLYLPLSGFVRYSLVNPPDAVAPAGPAVDVDDLEVTVDETDRETCLPPIEDPGGRYASYFCLMRVGTVGDPLQTWTGVVKLDDLPDDSRQCRYGPDPALVVPTNVSNAAHPRRHVNVDIPLANQNFLIVPDTADCPATTWAHP